MPSRERDEVEVRVRQVEQRPRARSACTGTDPAELDVEDRVRPVVEDDRRHVEAFTRLRPERLQRVHRAAVGLEVHDLAIRTGDRGTGCDRHAEPDRATGEREPVVARCTRSRARREQSVRSAPRRRRSRPRAAARRARLRRLGALSVTGRAVGTAGRLQRRAASIGTERVGELLERARDIVGAECERVHFAAVGHEQARLVGIGEERHRRGRVDEHEVPHAVELRQRELGEVAEPFDRRDARAPLEPGREHLAEQLGARRVRDATRRDAAPRSRSAAPPSSSAAGSPDRNALATPSITSPGTSPARDERLRARPARRLRATSCRPGG